VCVLVCFQHWGVAFLLSHLGLTPSAAHEQVNVIPVIAKADSVTAEEMAVFKKLVRACLSLCVCSRAQIKRICTQTCESTRMRMHMRNTKFLTMSTQLKEEFQRNELELFEPEDFDGCPDYEAS